MNIEAEVPTIETEMPVSQYRKWCTKCANWRPFNKIEDKYICVGCTEEFVEPNLSTIPADKVEQQRHRFRNQRRADFEQMLTVYRWMKDNPNKEYDGELKHNEIMEDDAGLLAIEDIERTQREVEHKAMVDDIDAHKKLGRNDVCICSSGKKYKKCCLKRIQSYRL